MPSAPKQVRLRLLPGALAYVKTLTPEIPGVTLLLEQEV